MLQWKRDLIISIVVLIFSIVNFIYAGQINTPVIKYSLAKPGNYVRLWLLIFAILAVILLIKTLMNKPEGVTETIWHRAGIITVVATVSYLFLLPYLGFIFTTVIYLAGLGLVYTYYMKTKTFKGVTLKKEIVKWLVFSTVFTAALYVMFAVVLDVILPSFFLL